MTEVPRPWVATVADSGDVTVDIMAEDGSASVAWDVDPTNAAVIVRAVNAHDDLLAALRDAKITLEESAKLLVSHYPSVANNIVNQCAIRCGDTLAKAGA